MERFVSDALQVEPEDTVPNQSLGNSTSSEMLEPAEESSGCCLACLRMKVLFQSEVPILLLLDTPEPVR